MSHKRRSPCCEIEAFRYLVEHGFVPMSDSQKHSDAVQESIPAQWPSAEDEAAVEALAVALGLGYPWWMPESSADVARGTLAALHSPAAPAEDPKP